MAEAAGSGKTDHFTYEVFETLRTSEAGALHRAVRTEDRRKVLLKVLSCPRAHDLEQLSNEVALRPVLDVVGALRPIQLDNYHGLPALVREDFEGIPLDSLASTPMQTDRFLRFAIGIARALGEIHRHGIVHRCLRAESILVLEPTGEAKITDFGIAVRLARVPSPTPPSLIEGALTHISPEQTGWIHGATDSRSDLYALGVTFYQMLTGRLPFFATDALGWVHCHVARSPLPPSQVDRAIPQVISAIVMQLLAKSADDRYQTAEGLRHDLERCLAESLAHGGRIAPFSIRDRDTPDRLLVPQKLYGRDSQVAALFAALKHVTASRSPSFFMLGGQAGVGKSTLAQKVREPLARARGFFASGKFDQYMRDIPYSTIGQAGRELVLQVLAEGEDRVSAWKQQLTAALGRDAVLLFDLIPELKQMTGPQPPLPDLPPAEAERRFQTAFRQLIRVFAGSEHPVVLFLDDLQWVDAESLRLFANLASFSDAGPLLLIGAYRDNEVGALHPLTLAVEEAIKSGAHVETMVLRPLSQRDITQLATDVVRRSKADAAPLAALVYQKTGGNPFFAIQFFAELEGKGLLEFEPGDAAWHWDIARIAAEDYTDNVIDLMVGKLGRLAPVVREVLAIASCIGEAPDVRTLALLANKTEAEVHRELSAAVEEGLLSRQDGTYRFSHDRVQEAAYHLTPAEFLIERHAQIGRLLLAHATPAERRERAFDIAVHLNRGARHLGGFQERTLAAQMNAIAGEKALASAACGSASEFFGAGIAHLGDGGFERSYDLAFRLHVGQAKCELSRGNIGAAEHSLEALLGAARGRHHHALVCQLQMELSILTGRMSEARRRGLAACGELFGIHLDESPADERVQRALAELYALLEQREIDSFAELPTMADQDMQDASAILTMLIPAVGTAGQSNLHDLIVCELARIAFEHGNSDAGNAAAVTYVKLGQLLMRQGMSERACKLAKVAEAVVARSPVLSHRAQIQLVSTAFINSWVRHPRENIADFEKGVKLSIEAGNLALEAFNWNQAALSAFAAGIPLPEVAAEAAKGLNLRRRVRFEPVMLGIVDAIGWLAATLRDPEHAPPLATPATPHGNFYQLLCRIVWHLLIGEPADAARLSLECRRELPFVRDLPGSSEYFFYAGLALAAHYDELPAAEQPPRRTLIAEHVTRVRWWMAANPITQRNRYCLLAAELARIDGRTDEAMGLYEQAIQAAKEGGFLHNEAMACERAAHFYRTRGLDRIADVYWGDARQAYARWGARAKVSEIDRRYRFPERPTVAAEGFIAPPHELDLLSVIRASQSISSEIVLERLERSLMQVLLQEGGAERGCLLLLEQGRPTVVVQATFDSEDGAIRVSHDGDILAHVPASIIDAALRRREIVVLDDASASRRFASCAWMNGRPPRSLLCLPILQRGEVAGALYLENNLVAGAFSAARTALLQILGTQAAISIQNAELLEQEHAARARAEAAERSSSLLAEASKAFGESLDCSVTLQQLSRIAVKDFAEFCVVDLIENGELRRVAAAHVDPTKQVLLNELQRRYAPRLGSRAPAVSTLSSGDALLLSDVDPADVRSMCVDDEHAQIVLELGPASVLCVPLVARGQTLGTITLCSSKPGRYGPSDLELARELARRAAIAVDNARLYGESQQAVRLRDEFLSVASHELRTPVHSLQLIVQGFTRGPFSLPEGTPPLLQIAERQIERMTRLIEELLEVSRIQAGRFELHPEPVNLATVVHDVVQQFAVEFTRARCPLSVHAEKAPVGLWDRGRLEQVVSNLLSNAIKFSPGRPIEIVVDERPAGTGHVAVTDHGIGVPAERIPYIFDRFERAVSSREYGGLGLGLYIARSSVEAAGGTIEVDSEPGVKTTFTVKLPLGRAIVEAR